MFDFTTLGQFLVAGLAMGSIYSLVALSLTLLYNAVGLLNAPEEYGVTLPWAFRG